MLPELIVSAVVSVLVSGPIAYVYAGWRLRRIKESDPEAYRRLME
ncbi:hypothetical protein SAMN05443661_102227 [Natronobacterium gregoryi]|uniref:Uncharacterized protein n=2 Tax=Natronobacterium gregoryi TaxID=44930 RepID=L0AHX0_NATGS|nr:hypothetical protein Natgr_1854 [Natronobacterium gregoryi SP2]SFI62988.1 hypothetical protein SAMN05443661_102227 [Natronobacterium gregoryi]